MTQSQESDLSKAISYWGSAVLFTFLPLLPLLVRPLALLFTRPTLPCLWLAFIQNLYNREKSAVQKRLLKREKEAECVYTAKTSEHTVPQPVDSTLLCYPPATVSKGYSRGPRALGKK